MKRMKKFLGILLACFIVVSGGIFSGKVWAEDTVTSTAKIGDQLVSPEAGWKRVEDSNNCFSYINLSSFGRNYSSGGTVHFGNSSLAAVKFYFVSKKGVRIIYPKANDASQVDVFVDGKLVDTYSPYITNTDVKGKNFISYINTQGDSAIHYVEIVKKDQSTSKYLYWDAVDIDTDGYIISPSTIQNLSLNPSSLNLIAGQTTATTVTATVYPDTATKNITWTLDDLNIAKIDSISSDGLSCNVKGYNTGTTTLRATSQDGTIVAICTITVNPNPARVILTLYLSNQTSRQYDLSATELNDFLAWYDNRTTGVGSVRYGFTKPASSAAFGKRTEYVVYDKIVAFDIDDYTSQVTK